MNTITVSLPESLHKQIQKLADQEGISVDQLATSALSEKIAALMSADYLAQRSQRGSRTKFEKALSKVADKKAEKYDTI